MSSTDDVGARCCARCLYIDHRNVKSCFKRYVPYQTIALFSRHLRFVALRQSFVSARDVLRFITVKVREGQQGFLVAREPFVGLFRN